MKFAVAFLVALAAGCWGIIVEGRHVMSARQAPEENTSNNCPQGWDPSPCTCTNSDSVECDKATTGEEIKTAFGRLTQNVAFDTFWMRNAPVSSLPSETFGKASFVSIFVSNSKLATVDDNAFKGSEDTLENFLFDNTEFETFNFNALKPLKKLKNFELSGNKLTSIPDEAFGNKPLETINLNGNKINSLGKNAFSQLSKLRRIDFSQNKLTTLGDFAFTTAADAQPISVLLGHNDIASINNNAFKDSKIKSMEFEDNKMETLSETVFGPIIESIVANQGQLSTLGNPFSCETNSVKWILELPAQKRGHIIGFMCRDGRALQQLTP